MTRKVMSFNVRHGAARDGRNHWNTRRELVFELLEDQAPDIVGLQEALPLQLDQICAAVPGFAEVGTGRDRGSRHGEHSAVLFRSDRFSVTDSGTFWFSETPAVPGSRHWGNRHARICTWVRLADRATQETFYFYNLHLDHWSQRSRVRSVGLLADRLADRGSGDPVIVTGDFNAGEGNRVLRFLLGTVPLDGHGGDRHNPVPLLDAFRTVHPHERRAGTYNKFWGHRGGSKIDFVLVSPEWKVRDAAVVSGSVGGRYASDHFPVTATIELPRSSRFAR